MHTPEAHRYRRSEPWRFSSDKAAAAAVVRTNSYAKVVDGNVLCILFTNPSMMAMIDKKDYGLFAECASRAFGKEMSIMVAPAEKEATLKPEEAVSVKPEVTNEDKNDKNFEDALNILQKLSQEEGFNIWEDEND